MFNECYEINDWLKEWIDVRNNDKRGKGREGEQKKDRKKKGRQRRKTERESEKNWNKRQWKPRQHRDNLQLLPSMLQNLWSILKVARISAKQKAVLTKEEKKMTTVTTKTSAAKSRTKTTAASITSTPKLCFHNFFIVGYAFTFKCYISFMPQHTAPQRSLSGYSNDIVYGIF